MSHRPDIKSLKGKSAAPQKTLRATPDLRVGKAGSKKESPKTTRSLQKNAKKTKTPPTQKRQPGAAHSHPPKSRSFFRTFLYISANLAVWGVILGLIGLGYLAQGLPDLSRLPAPGASERAVIIKAANGDIISRSGPIYGNWTDYEALPPALIQASLAIEDRNFFSHPGIDAKGLLRALLVNLKAGHIRAGGSTITQQLAKNLFLTPAQNLNRKAEEALLSLWIEQKFTKKQILTLYLNRAYFGGGAYGADAASRRFFGHGLERLSVQEAAMLAGLLKAPSKLAPHINPSGARERANLVLDAMAETGAISHETALAAKASPPVIKAQFFDKNLGYFTDYILRRVNELAPEAQGQSLIIQTSLDLATQKAGQKALETGFQHEAAAAHASQAALIALASDGAVRAMIGGINYNKSQYNRAEQALRQPGSAFKLFTYLAALEAGISPDQIYEDKPITIKGWSPKNYSNAYRGPMPLSEAFARSTNSIAVQLNEELGREKAMQMARRLGVSTPLEPIASLPLGTKEVKLMDLTGAYASLAAGGYSVEPYAILDISSLKGEVFYHYRPRRPFALLTPDTVINMGDMLKRVIAEGSGRNAQINRPAAGKTGTSQDNRDALFIGFTSELTAAVWVGNDDGTPMRQVTGGGMPARIWADFMTHAHEGVEPRPLFADLEAFRESARAGLRASQIVSRSLGDKNTDDSADNQNSNSEQTDFAASPLDNPDKAAKEASKKAKNPDKRGFWARLFGRDKKAADSKSKAHPSP